MTPAEFVSALKTQCRDAAVGDCIANFTSPPGRKPAQHGSTRLPSEIKEWSCAHFLRWQTRPCLACWPCLMVRAPSKDKARNQFFTSRHAETVLSQSSVPGHMIYTTFKRSNKLLCFLLPRCSSPTRSSLSRSPTTSRTSTARAVLWGRSLLNTVSRANLGVCTVSTFAISWASSST
jgi:hypothetical protein